MDPNASWAVVKGTGCYITQSNLIGNAVCAGTRPRADQWLVWNMFKFIKTFHLKRRKSWKQFIFMQKAFAICASISQELCWHPVLRQRSANMAQACWCHSKWMESRALWDASVTQTQCYHLTASYKHMTQSNEADSYDCKNSTAVFFFFFILKRNRSLLQGLQRIQLCQLDCSDTTTYAQKWNEYLTADHAIVKQVKKHRDLQTEQSF